MERDRIKELVAMRHGLCLDELSGHLSGFAPMLNPHDEPISVLYPLSNADVFTPIMMTNCRTLHCIDNTVVSSDFDTHVPSVLCGVYPVEYAENTHNMALEGYWQWNFRLGFVYSGNVTGNLFPIILTQLDALGVTSDIRYTEDGLQSTFRFMWQHPVADTPENYSITFSRQKIEPASSGLAISELWGFDQTSYSGIFCKAGLEIPQNLRLDTSVEEVDWIIGDGEPDYDLLRQRNFFRRDIPAELRASQMKLYGRGWQFGYRKSTAIYWNRAKGQNNESTQIQAA